MTADERTCAEVMDAELNDGATFKMAVVAIHPDLPDLPVEDVRAAIELLVKAKRLRQEMER